MRLVPLALALATAGTASCNRDLSVPDGSASPPGLSGVTPAKAFSGTLVTLRGHDLGSNPSLVNIRFGTSADVHPLKITADQTAAQVVVPDDAASGEVQLATALGQSTLTNAFVWQGSGRLLHRELALTSNLQQSVQPFPLPGRGQVALYSAWWSALHVLDADGTEHRPDANDVEVAATYDDGAGLLSISLGSEDPGCPALSLWDFPASGAPQKTCLPTTPPPLDVPDYLAASPDGKLIAAASPDLVTLIDRTGTLKQVQVAGAHRPRSPAWRTAGGFVLADGGTLRLLDATGALSEPVPVPGLQAGDDSWSDVRGDLVAICGASGALVLADATHWPPTFGAPSNTFGIFGQVAFSADATRLVLTDVSRAPGRINTYELTGGTAAPRPLNSVIASGGDVPIDPITAPNGTFYVGGTGGWYVLSAQTGAVTAHPLVSAQFTAPHLQAVAVDGAPDTLAVVMLSRSSDTRISVDPYSIQQQGADLGHGADDVVTSADGTDTFWLTGGTLTRNRDAQATFTLAPGSFTGRPKLSLAPGGGAVFLRYQTAANPDREKVVVLGAQGNWTSAPAPLELGLPQKLVGVASDGQQRVALLGAAGGQVYDLAAALGSRTAVTIGDPLTPRFPQATYLGMASDGTKLTALYRLVSTSSDYRQTSWALDDATLLSDWALPPSAEPLDNVGLFDSVVAAPGGRRIYWLTGASEQRRLLTLVLDPATGQVIGEENAISVPGGARDLMVYPDGQSLLVLDAEQDTLLLYR